ncbi:MAG: serine/threonine protein kinase [Planctomycetes bacterium]|nr:serine/threonine protein kinase [Planctomycetota bacterium]
MAALRGLLSGDHLTDLESILSLQQRVPGIELVSVIDHGQAGGWRLFAGRHLASDREVAVAVVDKAEPIQVRRFQREARIISGVRHRNLAEVIEAGEHKGLCYVATQLIDGPSFATVLRDYRDLPEVHIVALIRQFAAGLSALASQAGIIHRSVVPAIFRVPFEALEPGGYAGDKRPMIDDAGIIRGLVAARSASLIDPTYLAPELVRNQAIDQRSLVYALGAMLYHGLTGTEPFPAQSPDLVRKAHLFEAPPDPSRVLPDLCVETRRIIATAMKKSRDERFPSLDGFMSACDCALAALGAHLPEEVDATPSSGHATVPDSDHDTHATAILPVESPTPPPANATPSAGVPALHESASDDPFASPFDAADRVHEERARLAKGGTGRSHRATTADVRAHATRADIRPQAAEITSRILSKHAEMKERQGGRSTLERAKVVITESFLAAPAPRVDMIMGIILGNGWVDPAGTERLREVFRSNGSALVLRMRGGVTNLLVTRGILKPDQARELDLTLADQVRFTHFRISRILGEGPVGRSYVALDIANGIEVTFKVFRTSDVAKRERFLQEFHSFTRIDHVNVVPGLACGANEEVCFAATTYRPCRSLATLLRDYRILPEAYVVRLALQVAQGLAHVHARTGRLHLALKPGNVLVARVDGEFRLFPLSDTALVTDFGMSEHAPPFRTADLSYRAPEVLRGDVPDPRSDIYGLGALMYRMLTGETLGDDPLYAGSQVRTWDPGTKVADLHPLTREIVATALRSDPNQRFPDHDALIASLAQLGRELAEVYMEEPQIVSAPVDAPTAQRQEPSTRILRRHHRGPGGDHQVGPAGRATSGSEPRDSRTDG